MWRLLLTLVVASAARETVLERWQRPRHKRQINVVGSSCLESTSCRRGAYCDATRRCVCLSTFTEINGYCWQKINPTESGCEYTQQCSAVWPGAYCRSGTCRCANDAPSFLTRDGPVCLNYGYCPVNGEYSKLVRSDGFTHSCQAGADATCLQQNSGYDCICSDVDCIGNGFCCPTRGLACIMDKDEGAATLAGTATVTRYYYNSVTGSCDTFAYRGSKGNANNFVTRDQCESYCADACERGNPQYDAPVPLSNTIKGKLHYCSGTQSSTCLNTFECKTVGSRGLCCPKPSTHSPVLTQLAYDFIEKASNVSHQTWYYDETEKICKTFTYFGQSGNFNNFHSQFHCESYCAKVLCDAGEPLKDQTGRGNLQCSASSTCPATHDCVTEGVCCPKKQHVCGEPKAIGTCGNYVERFWYNAVTRNCESFTYSGCQKNDNNFKTYDDCQIFCKDTTQAPACPQGTGLKDIYGHFIVCGGSSVTRQSCPGNYLCYFDGSTYGCCPNKAFTCAQSYDAGTECGPSVSRWYYNAATKLCQTFTYNGCDGNSNNFATQIDCQDYCGVGGCPNGGEPFKENNGQYRSCTQGSSCPNSHYCTQVTLGTTTTHNYCCPTKTYLCSLPREQGNKCGSSTLDRYFFNAATRNCESFVYNGCDGNRNNYASLSQCLNYCTSAGCPAGQIAAADPSNNQLRTCALGLDGCDSGFTCTYSTLLGQSVCCGSPASPGTCPAGQTAVCRICAVAALPS